MKQEITITVDIPEGYEATGEFRYPVSGELYLENEGCADRASSEQIFGRHRFILREKWAPPEFLRPGWIAMDDDGNWFWHESEPAIGNKRWLVTGGCALLSDFNWTPPTVTDWKQSLTRIGGEE